MTGVEDLLGQLGRDVLVHFRRQRHFAGHQRGVDIVIRQQHRDIIGGRPWRIR
jgi:hypothetical protein